MQYLIKNNTEEMYKKKCLCIYFFYDKNGEVDDYVPLYLKAMRDFFSEVCVVVNGALTDDGREKLDNVSDKLIVRENIGFDSWAYKEALYSYGIDYIAKNFDEVLLNNFTCFGPIGSFKPMFDKMKNSVCDFWGHCRYYPSKGQRVRNQPIPEHLMSYFVLFRKNILESNAWKQYWMTLQPVNDYDDARLNHEFRLTPYFEKFGFISDAYISMERCHKIKGDNGSVHDAYDELISGKSPLLKRKVFFVKNAKYRFYKSYSRYNDIIYYINEHNLYDMKLVFNNLLRTRDFVFSKDKLTKWKKIIYYILGDLLKFKYYAIKRASYPDYNFIEKLLKK